MNGDYSVPQPTRKGVLYSVAKYNNPNVKCPLLGNPAFSKAREALKGLLIPYLADAQPYDIEKTMLTMNPKSSTGFPYNCSPDPTSGEVFKKKKQLIYDINKSELLVQDLRSALSPFDYDRAYSDDFLNTYNVWNLCPKVEILPKEKLFPGLFADGVPKPVAFRSICFPSYALASIENQYLGPIEALYRQASMADPRLGSQIGSSPFKGGAARMAGAQPFTDQGKPFSVQTTDLSTYDTTQSAEFIEAEFSILTDCIRDPNYNKVIRWIMHTNIHSNIVCPSGQVLRKSAGQNSGARNTSGGNTRRRWLLLAYCFFEIFPNANESDFFKYVKCFLMGDDDLVYVHPDYSDAFSSRERAAILFRDFGIIQKLDEPDSFSLHGHSFCGFNYMDRPIGGVQTLVPCFSTQKLLASAQFPLQSETQEECSERLKSLAYNCFYVTEEPYRGALYNLLKDWAIITNTSSILTFPTWAEVEGVFTGFESKRKTLDPVAPEVAPVPRKRLRRKRFSDTILVSLVTTVAVILTVILAIACLFVIHHCLAAPQRDLVPSAVGGDHFPTMSTQETISAAVMASDESMLARVLARLGSGGSGLAPSTLTKPDFDDAVVIPEAIYPGSGGSGAAKGLAVESAADENPESSSEVPAPIPPGLPQNPEIHEGRDYSKIPIDYLRASEEGLEVISAAGPTELEDSTSFGAGVLTKLRKDMAKLIKRGFSQSEVAAYAGMVFPPFAAEVTEYSGLNRGIPSNSGGQRALAYSVTRRHIASEPLGNTAKTWDCSISFGQQACVTGMSIGSAGTFANASTGESQNAVGAGYLRYTDPPGGATLPLQRRGAINIVSVPGGANTALNALPAKSYDPNSPTTVLSALGLTDLTKGKPATDLADGPIYIMGCSFTVTDVSPVISKQGSCTVWNGDGTKTRQTFAQGEKLINSNATTWAPKPPTSFVAIQAFDAELAPAPPSNIADVVLNPTYLSWPAQQGAFCIARRTHYDGEPEAPNTVVHGYHSSSPESTQVRSQILLASGPDLPITATAPSVYEVERSVARLEAPLPTGLVPGSVLNTSMPFNNGGAYFTGLSSATVLQIDARFIVCSFPRPSGGRAEQAGYFPPPYNPMLLSLISRAQHCTLAGYVAAENASGSAFLDILQTGVGLLSALPGPVGAIAKGASMIGEVIRPSKRAKREERREIEEEVEEAVAPRRRATSRRERGEKKILRKEIAEASGLRGKRRR